ILSRKAGVPGRSESGSWLVLLRACVGVAAGRFTIVGDGIERASQIQRTGKKLLAHRAKKPFDFSFGRSIPHGGVMEQAADAGADLDDFLGAIDGAVVHIEGLEQATFVESST